MRRVLLLLPLCLAGCGGAASSPPQDEPMEQAFTAGELSLTQRDPAAAETQFEAAYGRALLRDDTDAIADAGYDLAAAQLARDEANAAFATAERTRAALALRGRAVPPPLSLVEAWALHRVGDDDHAAQSAVEAARAPEPALAARAQFLLGLIADRRGDIPALAAARDAVRGRGAPPSASRLADEDELSARLALHEGQPAAAEQAATEAASARRTLLDYRGMRTALGLAAIAARDAGASTRAAAYQARIAESLAADTKT